MQQDEVTWNIISKQFCSFQVKTQTQKFCRNEYNLTGFCSKRSCPIANSQYATVRETDGIVFLYMKTAERNPFPVKHWEKVKLSRNYDKAIYQIKEHLLFWDRWVQNKCKQRFNKITQNLMRTRRLQLRRQKMMVPLATKVERRERRREDKALIAARIDDKIQKELLERLKLGLYNDVYNFPSTAFEQALVPEELDEDSETSEKEQELEFGEEFVDYNSDTGSESGVPERIKVDSDFESDDCSDIEDCVSSKCLLISKSKSQKGVSTSVRATKKLKTLHEKTRRKREIEYEVEADISKRDNLRY